MMSHEQLHMSQKNQVHQWFELADKSLDETEKFLDLQLSACRETLQEMALNCQRACDVRDMPGAFSWQTAAFKPLAEHSAQYGARLIGLASGSGREFSRSFENQWHAMGQQMRDWMGGWPLAGQAKPQDGFDYLRNTMNAFDSVWESARQQMQQSQAAAMQTLPTHKASSKGARKGA